jgi:hypothetical protein
MQDSGTKTPLLLLLLGTPPPVQLRGRDRLHIADAVRLHLRSVHARTGSQLDLETLEALVEERVAWTTWSEVAAVVTEQVQRMTHLDESTFGTVHRLSGAITEAVAWHSSHKN